MPAKSKIKGSANEVEVARILSKWWGEPFKRTPNSGALRWHGAAFTYGDLLPPESFPCIVECKHYKDVDVDEILRKDDDQGMITWWWYYQTIPDAKRCLEERGERVQPLLIWKMNYRPFRLVMSKFLWIHFSWRHSCRYIECNIPEREPFVMLGLMDFLEKAQPDDFRDLLEEIQSGHAGTLQATPETST